MSISLLTTKFYFPPVRTNLVQRPRLVERLVIGLCGPLTLISAPAGYGKTTLLSEWHAGIGKDTPTAWLSLDEGENEPRRFFQYFLAALEQLQPGLAAASRTLQSLEPSNWEPVLTLTLNYLSRLENDSVLVLDDYHQIENPDIHTSLTFFLEYVPPRLHLVLLTRSDPPLPLYRLRSRGQLVEIRSSDLRFTNEESIIFLNIMMGLSLSEESVSALGQRTEGWIAGLQMAALSMQGKEDTTAFVQSFTGSNRYILDYLTEEVLQQQPESIQTFLLRTSILDRFNSSLCDALWGEMRESNQVLTDLERKNMFLIPLDDERQWYRYHHLFSELLFQRLKKTQPEILNELYMRAAGWLEAHDYLENAVGYALKAQNYERAIRLMNQIKNYLWNRGEIRMLINWFNTLPEELVRSDAELCLAYAASLTIGGYLDAAEKWLQVSEDILSSLDATDAYINFLFLKIPVYRSVIARYHGDFRLAIGLCEGTLERIPSSDLRSTGVVHLFLGQAHFYAGNTDSAEQVLTAAMRYNLASGHLQAYLNACHNLAQLRMLQGSLHEARMIYEQAALTIKDQATPVFAGAEHACLGDLYREWNQLKTAAVEIQKGIELAEAGDHIMFLTDVYLAGLQLALAQKDWQAASIYLQKAERVTRRCPSSLENELLRAWQARLQLAQGSLAETVQWADKKEAEIGREGINGPSDPQREFELLTLARIWLAQGKTEQAGDLLERIHTTAVESKRHGRALETRLLLALAGQAAGKELLALEVLSWVLAQARPEGYVRLFLDEGEPMAQMLRKVSTRTAAEIGDYARRLLAAYDREILEQQALAGRASPAKLLSEPLSERELEVLHLIAAGCSNQEIASRLVIALGTVKRHTANIYDKLEVKNRTEAAVRARELSLLLGN